VSPLWRRKYSDRIRQQEAASRERQEREKHKNNMEIICALNRVANEQKASRDQEHTYENKKGLREWLTIEVVPGNWTGG
jgi:hypothetical protein